LELLHKLQQNDDYAWDDDPEFVIWLIFIGGAFAPSTSIRLDYIEILHGNRASECVDDYSSWPTLLELLKRFIWSEKVFTLQVKAFWEECSM
jgi:hypothetical protein